MTIINRCVPCVTVGVASSLLNGNKCRTKVKMCSPSTVMVTSPYEWKILEWDDKPQTKKTSKQTMIKWNTTVKKTFHLNFKLVDGVTWPCLKMERKWDKHKERERQRNIFWIWIETPQNSLCDVHSNSWNWDIKSSNTCANVTDNSKLKSTYSSQTVLKMVSFFWLTRSIIST